MEEKNKKTGNSNKLFELDIGDVVRVDNGLMLCYAKSMQGYIFLCRKPVGEIHELEVAMEDFKPAPRKGGDYFGIDAILSRKIYWDNPLTRELYESKDNLLKESGL